MADLTPALAGNTVLVRARLHGVRAQGRFVFLTLRQACATVQAVLAQGKGVSKAMIKYATSLTKESVIEIEATAATPPEPIASTSIQVSVPASCCCSWAVGRSALRITPDPIVRHPLVQNVELQVAKLWTVSKALGTMPFDLADASVVYEKATTDAEGRKVEEGDDVRKGGVGQDLRLDYRWIDLRTTAHNAIMRISSGVCTLFREFLLSYVGRWRWGTRSALAARVAAHAWADTLTRRVAARVRSRSKNFVEIQTPKLQPGASEGGAEVFTLDYFGRTASLAQSPQLYKQMTAACSDFERVFEIGPVFRAEDSNTRRTSHRSCPALPCVCRMRTDRVPRYFLVSTPSCRTQATCASSTAWTWRW